MLVCTAGVCFASVPSNVIISGTWRRLAASVVHVKLTIQYTRTAVAQVIFVR